MSKDQSYFQIEIKNNKETVLQYFKSSKNYTYKI